MRKHDPYGPMLLELCSINDNDTEKLLIDSLHQAQEYVTNLRFAYDTSPSNVDFSCAHTRAAYLLAYYPHYIEPIYEILTELPDELIQTLFGQRKLRGLFLGAGPAPEVLGLIAFLSDCVPTVKSATMYLLDKYVHGWRTGQEITRYHLAPRYWIGGNLAMRPMEFDFLDPATLDDPFVQRSIQISNIVVMQNCLNDQLGNRQAVLEMMQSIFVQTNPGTLFLISDLNYTPVRAIMKRMARFITENSLGDILLPVKDEYSILKSNFELPEIIQEHLLTGDEEKKLIARKYTKYFYSVFLRTK